MIIAWVVWEQEQLAQTPRANVCLCFANVLIGRPGNRVFLILLEMVKR